ncbi:rod shape-determining protein [Kribbella solani]
MLPMGDRMVTGIAIDLGSARTRIWTTEHGLVADVPTHAPGTSGRRGLVYRGEIVNAAATASFLATLLGRETPTSATSSVRMATRINQPDVGNLVEDGGPRRSVGAARKASLPAQSDPNRTSELTVGRRLTVVAVVPVLGGERQRLELRTVLDVLGPAAVVTLDGAKAVAFGARVGVAEPLLVVDVGAQLIEVALLTDGAVVEARRTPLGVDDLSAAEVVEEVADAVLGLLQGDCCGQVVDALDRGVLLAGGGALRPEITYKLSRRIGATVRPAPAPHTAAVRGAATALQATHRHPGTRNA